MLPDNFIPLIKKLAYQCEQLGMVWAFTGSLNLLFWGFDLEPHDVDLETDRFSADQFARLYMDQAVWSLHLRESECMQSWFARYDIDDVQVEVMGDCQYRSTDGGWVAPRPLEKRIRRIDWQDLSLPLLDLEDEREICTLMGRLEKAERIRAWLEKPPDFLKQ